MLESATSYHVDAPYWNSCTDQIQRTFAVRINLCINVWWSRLKKQQASRIIQVIPLVLVDKNKWNCKWMFIVLSCAVSCKNLLKKELTLAFLLFISPRNLGPVWRRRLTRESCATGSVRRETCNSSPSRRFSRPKWTCRPVGSGDVTCRQDEGTAPDPPNSGRRWNLSPSSWRRFRPVLLPSLLWDQPLPIPLQSLSWWRRTRSTLSTGTTGWTSTSSWIRHPSMSAWLFARPGIVGASIHRYGNASIYRVSLPSRNRRSAGLSDGSRCPWTSPGPTSPGSSCRGSCRDSQTWKASVLEGPPGLWCTAWAPWSAPSWHLLTSSGSAPSMTLPFYPSSPRPWITDPATLTSAPVSATWRPSVWLGRTSPMPPCPLSSSILLSLGTWTSASVETWPMPVSGFCWTRNLQSEWVWKVGHRYEPSKAECVHKLDYTQISRSLTNILCNMCHHLKFMYINPINKNTNGHAKTFFTFMILCRLVWYFIGLLFGIMLRGCRRCLLPYSDKRKQLLNIWHFL